MEDFKILMPWLAELLEGWANVVWDFILWVQGYSFLDGESNL